MQGILTKDRPSPVRIQEHTLMSHTYNKYILFEQYFVQKKFLSPCFGDFSNAVLTNNIPGDNFLTEAKESVEVRGMKNDLPSVGDARKSSMLMASENTPDLITSDVDAHLQGVVVKAVKKKYQCFSCCSKTADDDILTIIQDINDVDEEKEYENIPSRNKSSVTIDEKVIILD